MEVKSTADMSMSFSRRPSEQDQHVFGRGRAEAADVDLGARRLVTVEVAVEDAGLERQQFRQCLGRVRRISSAVMIVMLAGRRATSSSRVAVTTTGFSVLAAKAGGKTAATAAHNKDRRFMHSSANCATPRREWVAACGGKMRERPDVAARAALRSTIGVL